jgi:hypothetical protein
MFSFVFGLSGRFTAWCEQVTAALVAHAGNCGRLLRADCLEALALQAMEHGTSAAAVASQRPGGGLRAAVVGSGRNFIVAVEDPRIVLAELAFGEDVGWADAISRIASGCAALDGLAAMPTALALYRDRDWSRPADTAAAIARHLGVPIDGAELRDLVAGVAAAAPSPPVDAAAGWQSLSLDQQELARGALLAFIDDNVQTAPAPVITWGRELFFFGDRPLERVSGAIDITGRARCLMQGPDILLPPSAWSLSLTASFRQGAAEHEFTVEVDADQLLATGTIRPEREGSATITLDFALEALTERPITLRLSSRRAAFDGAIELIGATLVRMPAPPAIAAA